jgi:hypothetical protein
VLDLIKAGANINGYQQDFTGTTPLMLAAVHNNLVGVSLLLKLGANPYVKYENGKTAYDFCTSDECRNIFTKFDMRRAQTKLSNNVLDLILQFKNLDCRNVNEIDQFVQNLNIDINDPRWVGSSLSKKCWLAENMISLVHLSANDTLPDRRLTAALNNYNAAISQGYINAIPDEFKNNLYQQQVQNIEAQRRKNNEDIIKHIGGKHNLFFN